MAMRAMKKQVIAPITITKERAASESSKSGDMRATMKMPAVTMVAAWIKAEIGVGSSIESGSHTCRGTCADLPMAPTNRQMQVKVIAGQTMALVTWTWAAAIWSACANTVA